jgi:hypothetical protein
MRFLLYIFTFIIFIYPIKGHAIDAYSPIVANLSVCEINDDGYFFNVRTSQKPGDNCAGFWPDNNKLPICRRNSDFSLQYGQVPRKNCYDLVHLPLCYNIVDVDQRIPGKTCVYECKNLHLSSIQYMPNYGHNYYKNKQNNEGEEIGCVRFCDDPIRSYGEDIKLTTKNKECVRRMCHQYIKYEDNFTSDNCQKIPCNLLYKEEISYNKEDKLVLRNELVKFNLCQNEFEIFKEIERGRLVINIKDKIKCYDFGLDKLPLVRQWLKFNPEMCEIHSCYTSKNQQRFIFNNNISQTSNEYCPFRGEILELIRRCDEKKYHIDNNCEDNASYLEEYVTEIIEIDLKKILSQILKLKSNDCRQCNKVSCITNQEDCFEKCISCYGRETDAEYRELAIYEILGSSCNENTEYNNIFDNFCYKLISTDIYVYNDSFIKKNEDSNMCKIDTPAMCKNNAEGKKLCKETYSCYDNCTCYNYGLMCDKTKSVCDLKIDSSLFYELISESNKICKVKFGNNIDCQDEYNKGDALRGNIGDCILYKPYDYKNRDIFKCKIFQSN